MIASYQPEVVQKLQNYSLAERVRLARLALLAGVNLAYGDGLAPGEVLAKFKQDAGLTTARPRLDRCTWPIYGGW